MLASPFLTERTRECRSMQHNDLNIVFAGTLSAKEVDAAS